MTDDDDREPPATLDLETAEQPRLARGTLDGRDDDDPRIDAALAVAAGWQCQCGAQPDAAGRPRCLCGRNPTRTGAWVHGGDPRLRFVRRLDAAARLLRISGRGGATLGHALVVATGDLGSVAGRWFLEIAVPSRESCADLWWRGYPFQLARTLDDAPWLSLPGVGGSIFLSDDEVRLEVIDAFASGSGRPLEVLVAHAKKP
jgi:hypothetical protein